MSSKASPAILPPPAPRAGLVLVENGNNSCVTLNDATGKVLAVLIYFNADSGKIRANVGSLNPDEVGQIVEINPDDNCLVVNRPA